MPNNEAEADVSESECRVHIHTGHIHCHRRKCQVQGQVSKSTAVPVTVQPLRDTLMRTDQVGKVLAPAARLWGANAGLPGHKTL